MKILVCVLFVWCATACAQVPSFRSFNPPQFSTNGFIVSLKDPLVVTNITVISNLVSQTIITTNLYATNLYVTNIFNDITFNGRVTFNTNVTYITQNGSLLGLAGWYPANLFVRTNYYYPSLASGLVDVYTVPTGYRFLTGNFSGVTTNTVGSVTTYLKRNGDYFKMGGPTTITTNQQNGVGIAWSSDDTIAASNTVAGCNFFLGGYLYPETTGWVSPILTNINTTPQLFYTVPADKTIWNAPTGMNSSVSITFVNTSGATRFYTGYVLPGGVGSLDLTTVALRGLSVNSGSTGTAFFVIGNPGDEIWIHSDGNDQQQVCYATIAEAPR